MNILKVCEKKNEPSAIRVGKKITFLPKDNSLILISVL